MSRLPVLLAVTALLLIAGLLLLWSSRRLRCKAGLPAGRVVSADTGAWQPCAAPLYSSRYRLTGRPDYLVSTARHLIPVEVKSGHAPRTPHRGHLLQLAAYCLLAEETYGCRVPYGLLHYADATLRVPFDRRLRRQLLATLGELQLARGQRVVHRSHQEHGRCDRCGLRHACRERLTR